MSASKEFSKTLGSIDELSVVIPLFNDSDLLDHALGEIVRQLDEKGLSWELILVDDCSSDDTAQTLSSMQCLKRPNVKIYRMRRNFGQHVALYAGLTHASKQWRLTFDADYVSAFSHIDQVLEKAVLGGHDLVSVSRRGQRKLSMLRHAGTRFLNYLTNRATKRILHDPLSPVKLVHESLVENTRYYGELRRFLAPLAIRLSQNPGEVSVPLPHKRGKSHYGIFLLIRMTLDFILNFFPGLLTRFLVTSIFLAISSFLAGLVYVAMRLLGVMDASVYAQVIILIVLVLSINGVTLGIIGEYHVRMYQLIQTQEFYQWEEKQ